MPQVIAESDNLQVQQYDNNNAVHFYEIDPVTGVRRHISADDVLTEQGFDPADSAANYALRNPNQTPNPANPNLDPNVQALLQTMNQILAQNQNLIGLLQQTLTNMANQLQNPPNPTNPANPNQNPTPPTPEQQALTNAEAAMAAARDTLLEYTIRRKARTGDGLLRRRREDAQDYELAMNAYQTTLNNYLAARRGLELSTHPNAAPSDVGQVLMRAAYSERRTFIEREHILNNEHLDSLGWRGKFRRAWANTSTSKKVAIGLVVGVGAGVVSGGLGLGLFGLAVGTASRFSLGLVNKQASARNVSEHSKNKMLKALDKLELRALARFHGAHAAGTAANLAGDQDLTNFRNQVISEVRNDYDGYVQHAQRLNKIGTAILGLSLLPAAEAIPGMPDIPNLDFGILPNIHLPHINVPGLDHTDHLGPGGSQTGGGPGYLSGHPPNTPPVHPPPAASLNFTHFKPDTFVGNSGPDAVKHALLGGNGFPSVFEANNMHVDPSSVTTANIQAINADLVNQHFHIASGINGSHHQNILDWPGDKTANYNASAQQGFEKVNGASSVDNWKKFAAIAQKHGVKITQVGD